MAALSHALQNAFLGDAPGQLWVTIIRCGFVYLSILAALRVVGKRHVASLSIVDFVLVLLVSNAVQNAMVGSDTSILGGIVAAVTLILVNVALTKLVLKNERLGSFLEGEPTLLIRDGQILENHCAREAVRQAELEAALREHGICEVKNVKQAVLEIDGSISVVPMGEDPPKEHRVPPLRRHRHAGRRGYKPGQT